MGIIARQAFWNSLSIVSATLIGAVNTVIVLPNAFEGFEEGWGLIGLMISGAMVYAPFLSLGASNIIIRYYESHVQLKRAPSFLGFATVLPLMGILLFSLAFTILEGDILNWMANSESDIQMLEQFVPYFFIMTIGWTGFQVLTGYVSAIYKTSFFQMLNEVGVKGTYFLLAMMYWVQWITYDQMVKGYVGIYVLLFGLLLIFSLLNGFKINTNWSGIDKKGITIYGLFSILDKGATILVNRLDIIMISILMSDLANVAYYTLAFYMGSVVLIPQKSILAIANPIASRAIQQKDDVTLKDVYQKSALNQLILGGMIFMLIWANIDAIMYLMPDKFQGGKWVVFFIGLSKLFFLMAGVNGGIIVYSKYYRANLVINLFLVVLTIISNVLLIPLYGLNGAAMATAISLLVYNAAKTIYVHQKFLINQLTRNFGLSCLFLLILSILGYYICIPSVHPLWEIIIKSFLLSLIYVIGVYRMKLSPDIVTFVQTIWRKISGWT